MQTGKGISIPSILKVGKGALTKIGSVRADHFCDGL